MCVPERAGGHIWYSHTSLKQIRYSMLGDREVQCRGIARSEGVVLLGCFPDCGTEIILRG